MSRITATFSGEAKYVSIKDVGDKKVLEFQIAKKNYSKERVSKEDEQWTNLRVSMFGAHQMDIDRIKDGVFVTGSGDLSVRSYIDKAGVKKQSNDVRVQAGGLDTAYAPRGEQSEAPAPKVTHRQIPADTSAGNDEPPF